MKADVLNIVVDIAHVVEQHPPEVIADQWKTHFGGMKQQRVAAQRKSCLGVARTRLIIGKRAIRCRAAGEPSLGQGSLRRSSEALNVAELQATGDYDIFADRMVGRIAPQQPREVRLRRELA